MRRRIGRRHAVGRKAAVEMRVGADCARLDLAVGARQMGRARRRRGDDAAVDDRHAAAAGVGSDDERAGQCHWSRSPSGKRPTLMARAAGESFIGRRMRRTPS